MRVRVGHHRSHRLTSPAARCWSYFSDVSVSPLSPEPISLQMGSASSKGRTISTFLRRISLPSTLTERESPLDIPKAACGRRMHRARNCTEKCDVGHAKSGDKCACNTNSPWINVTDRAYTVLEVMHMFRSAISQLIDWKKRPGHLPLIIRGARQVGKTWLMKEFGTTQYEKMAYVNFDSNPRMERLFSGDLDIRRLVAGLQLETGVTIDPANTLTIFDEVQEVPRALTSLKYFTENAPEYNIVAAGSLLGVALHQGTSFPVGKVEFLNLHPLSFDEFLRAIGKDRYAEMLHEDISLACDFREAYVEMLAQYHYVGGMPEPAFVFSQRGDFQEVRAVQRRILEAYEQDFSKHAPNDTVPRLRMLWQAVPSQLARENRKFRYQNLKPGARAREYELAMQWLLDCGLIYKVHRVSKPDLPLTAYADPAAFKLYMLDVGLLSASCGLDAMTLLQGNRVFGEFKGALAEQYVLQQLIACGMEPVHYWSSDSGAAEVDFVIQCHGNVYPIEVKAAENLQAKSLKVYREKYKPGVCVRASLSNYRKDDWLVNVPLYAVGAIDAVLEQ